MSVKKHRKRTDHSGSTFDSFLEQEGIREEVEAVAIKRMLAWQSDANAGRGLGARDLLGPLRSTKSADPK
jgi:antitoxin HicB